jgi:peptidoglycan/LPS O-acetylase OafA/YrhL
MIYLLSDQAPAATTEIQSTRPIWAIGFIRHTRDIGSGARRRIPLWIALRGTIEGRQSVRSSTRFVELDALRGIAALWVMLFHYLTRYNQMFDPNKGSLLGFDVPNGSFGVYLFFIISGHVIFMTLHNLSRPIDFLISRFSRLFPTYWTSVLLTSAVGFYIPLPDQHITLKIFLVNLTMLQDFFYIPDVDGAYWSLSVELSFYALIFTVYLTKKMDRIEIYCFIWLFVSLSDYFLGYIVPWRLSHLLVLKYAPWFIIGIEYYFIRNIGYRAIGMILMASCLGTELFISSASDALIMALFIVMFHFAVFFPIKTHFIKPLIWIGYISFPLYVIHQMIGYRVLRSLLHQHAPPSAAIEFTVVGAVLIASLISFGIERPAMRLIRGWYRRSVAAAPAAV